MLMVVFSFLLLLLGDYNFNFSLPKLDIESLKKITEKDTVTMLRKCKDLEGREAILSISATQIFAPQKKVLEVLWNPQMISRAAPGIKSVKVLKQLNENTYDVEFEIEIKIISFIRLTVRYIAQTKLDGNKILSFIRQGDSKGGWRIWETYETEKGTLAILGMCEHFRNIPLVSKIFLENPHFEIGMASSTTLIPVLYIKKFIEKNQISDEDYRKNQQGSKKNMNQVQ
jgi:hypothetical protein